MTDEHNGWTEYRLMVTSVLERHDAAIDNLETGYHELKTDLSERRSLLRQELMAHVDAKFGLLGNMHETQVANAKRELVEEMNKQRAEDAQVRVAKITSSWQFWSVVVVQIATVVVAVLALMK